MSEWQPIETAPITEEIGYLNIPNDAERVLVLGADGDIEVAYVARDDKGLYGATGLYLSEGIGHIQEPKYWMPLPKKPLDTPDYHR